MLCINTVDVTECYVFFVQGSYRYVDFNRQLFGYLSIFRLHKVVSVTDGGRCLYRDRYARIYSYAHIHSDEVLVYIVIYMCTYKIILIRMCILHAIITVKIQY